MIYSFSRLKKYQSCPAAFYKKYVLEIPETPSMPAVLGKAVHSALQHLYSGSTLKAAVETALAAAELPVKRDEIIRLSSHPYVSSLIPMKEKNVEHHFEHFLDGAGSPILQGYMDFWWQDQYGINLIDWKTNRVKFSPLKNHQLGLYAWYLQELTGCKRIHGILVFLRFAEANCQETVEYEQADIEAARTWALNLASEIDSKLAELSLFNGDPDKLFPATPGSQCEQCSYTAACYQETQDHTNILTPITSLDTAKTLAAEIIRIEAVLTEMKENLKKWVQENSPVTVGEHEFCLTPSVGWTFRPEKLRELCQALSKAGINPWEVLTIASAQLKKIDWPEEKLAKYGSKREAVTFRKVKIQKDIA